MGRDPSSCFVFVSILISSFRRKKINVDLGCTYVSRCSLPCSRFGPNFRLWPPSTVRPCDTHGSSSLRLQTCHSYNNYVQSVHDTKGLGIWLHNVSCQITVRSYKLWLRVLSQYIHGPCSMSLFVESFFTNSVEIYYKWDLLDVFICWVIFYYSLEIYKWDPVRDVFISSHFFYLYITNAQSNYISSNCHYKSQHRQTSWTKILHTIRTNPKRRPSQTTYVLLLYRIIKKKENTRRVTAVSVAAVVCSLHPSIPLFAPSIHPSSHPLNRIESNKITRKNAGGRPTS